MVEKGLLILAGVGGREAAWCVFGVWFYSLFSLFFL